MYPIAITSAEFRSVIKLFTKVCKTGSNTSGGTNSWEACAINCKSLVTSERRKNEDKHIPK